MSSGVSKSVVTVELKSMILKLSPSFKLSMAWFIAFLTAVIGLQFIDHEVSSTKITSLFIISSGVGWRGGSTIRFKYPWSSSIS
jgi:hypothetical protein